MTFFIAWLFVIKFNHSFTRLKMSSWPAKPRNISHIDILQLACSSACSVSLRSPAKLHKSQADTVNPPRCSHENPPQANHASKNNCSHLKAMREWYLIIWVHSPDRLLFPSDPPHPTFLPVARTLWGLLIDSSSLWDRDPVSFCHTYICRPLLLWISLGNRI